MRKIIAHEHLSLDGVIQAPGGSAEDTSGGFRHGGWIASFDDAAHGTALRAQMNKPFDLLLGRHTFEIWAPYWLHHGAACPNVNLAIKYVASNTLTSSAWQPTVFLNGDIVSKITQRKQQPGRDIHVWGSSDFVQTLLAHDLVDALWLMVYPLTLGTGKHLFGSGTIPVAFHVVESIATPSGAMVMHYVRTRVE